MTRTWDENREAINDLWPLMELRPAERQLWHDDLSPLDQEMLYESLREVKRSHESPWPQLAWIHGAYRTLQAAKATAERKYVSGSPAYSTPRLEIDEAEAIALRNELMYQIDEAPPEDFDSIHTQILGSVNQLNARDVVRLVLRLEERRRNVTA